MGETVTGSHGFTSENNATHSFTTLSISFEPLDSNLKSTPTKAQVQSLLEGMKGYAALINLKVTVNYA